MRSQRERLVVNGHLHVCKTLPRDSRLRKRYQIGLVICRYAKTWKSPMVKQLVLNYGVDEC